MSMPETSAAREMTFTERADHITDRAQNALNTLEQIETKLFGSHPAPCDVIDAPDVPSLDGALQRARIIVEERLLPLLQEIDAKL